MHIVRLYYTAFDILEKGEIITRRDKEREELLAIRNGKYLREDGSYAPEFFEFVDALEKRFQNAATHKRSGKPATLVVGGFTCYQQQNTARPFEYGQQFLLQNRAN